MAETRTYPHIEKSNGAPARLQRVPRIRVAQIVMDYLAHGWSAAEIFRQHPHLTPAEVHAALAYYFDHREEIDSEIAAEWAEANKVAESVTPPYLAKLKERGTP
jgi:uncharacterized protein (DUF433 family)